MIIQNRKTGKEYEVSKADYQKLIDKNLHRRFKVIDDTDITKTKILVPKEILEYQQKKIEIPAKIEKTNKSEK